MSRYRDSKIPVLFRARNTLISKHFILFLKENKHIFSSKDVIYCFCNFGYESSKAPAETHQACEEVRWAWVSCVEAAVMVQFSRGV